jgi:hypothetical protein
MPNLSQQLDIVDKLVAMMQADSTLSDNFETFLDHIPDDLAGNAYPLLAVDWSGDTHKSAAIGGYRIVCSLFTILIATNDWEQKEARRNLIELSGLVTDFLSQTGNMQQDGYWQHGKLAEGGQNVRVGRSDTSEGTTGFVYSALVLWEADYRKTKVT